MHDGQSPDTYRFGSFLLDLGRGMLLNEDVEVPLRPKSFTLLQRLVEEAGHLQGRDVLMQAVWPGVFVTDDSLAQCIKEIRRALRDEEQRLLRTMPRRGYLFAAPVVRLRGTDTQGAPPLAAPPTGRPMLVVLPFEAVGVDPEHAHLAGGLTADLVTDLMRFQEIHVVSPTAARPPAELPEEVGYVLSGTVRLSGTRLRVTSQLRSAVTGIGLWAERFERPLDDIFSVQEEVANHIAALIVGQIGREDLRQVRRRPPANLDAYGHFLQGRAMHGQVTEAASGTARDAFDRAISADPDFAPAHAYQAYTVVRGFTLGWGQPRGPAALPPALRLARHAVELEPRNSICRMRLAFVLCLLGEHDEALEQASQGVLANPCEPASRAAYGEVLSMSGQHAEGVTELRLAMTLDPFHPPFWRATLGRALLLQGDIEQSLAELRRSAALAPDYRPGHSTMVAALVEAGMTTEARKALGEVLRLRPGWVLRDYDGVFGLRRPEDTRRILSAFRHAGMAER
jgi:adenylate cyclase